MTGALLDRVAWRPLPQCRLSRRTSPPCYPLRLPARPYLLHLLWAEGFAELLFSGGRRCPSCRRVAGRHKMGCDRRIGVTPRALFAVVLR